MTIKKIKIADDINEIEISNAKPALILLNGIDPSGKKRKQERHLKVTQNGKLVLL